MYALAFLGTWTFDKTMCASADPSCCCLDGKTEIKLNPSGHPSFFIEGHPSIGCRAQPGAAELQDDFPFPHPATKQSFRVVGFLPNQDTYQITINAESAPIYTLSLVDQTVPQCSMFATMLVDGKVATSWATWVAILSLILGAFLAAVGMYCWHKRTANSSKNADSKPLLNVNIDRERVFYN